MWGTTIGETGGSRSRRGAYLWCHRTASFPRSRRSIGASSIWTQQDRGLVEAPTFGATAPPLPEKPQVNRRIADLDPTRFGGDDDGVRAPAAWGFASEGGL